MPASFPAHITPTRAALLILCFFAAYLAGFNNAAPPKPSVVAVVDLIKLMDGLKMKVDAEAAIKVFADGLEVDRKAKVALADRLGEDKKLYTPGTKEFTQAEEKWKRANIDAAVCIQFQKFKIEQRKNEDIRKIYEAVKKALAKYCSANEIDVVIMDDSVVPFAVGAQANIMEQISARRVLYADQELDITKALMEWINANGP